MAGSGKNVDVVERFYEEAINRRDATACGRLLSSDFTHNGELRGRQGQQEAVNAFLAAFPDLRNEILLTVAQGDLVAAHQKWYGTHAGEFLDILPTNREVEFTSTAVLRLEGGLIAEAWDVVDLLGLRTQLTD